MNESTVEKRLLSALHEAHITNDDIASISRSDLTVKLENICVLEGIDISKYDISSIAHRIDEKGFNELRVPLSNFFRDMKFSYNKSNI